MPGERVSRLLRSGAMRLGLGSLLNRGFAIVVVGDLVSKAGDYVYRLAVPMLVLDITGSAIWAGLAFGTQLCGTFVSGLLAGPVVDRSNPTRVTRVVVLVMAGLTLAVPVSIHFGGVSVWLVVVVGFALEAFNFAYRTGVNSLVPLLVAREQLPTAAATLSTSRFVSKTAGPAVAGVLITSLGNSGAILADAGSFLVLFALLLLARPATTRDSAPADQSHRLRSDMTDGFRYIVRNRQLLWLNMLNLGGNIGYVPVLAMLVIHLRRTVGLNPTQIGMIYTVDGIAALLAGLSIPFVMRRLRIGHVLVSGSLLLGAAIVLLGLTNSVVAIAGALFVVLGSAQVVNRTMYTYWQMTVPHDYLGRVFGTSAALESLAAPLAAVAAGFVLKEMSSYTLMIGSGLVILGATAACVKPIVSVTDSRENDIARNENRNSEQRGGVEVEAMETKFAEVDDLLAKIGTLGESGENAALETESPYWCS